MAAATLPPGPPGRPVAERLADLTRDPLAFLTRCARDYGDVVRVRFGPAHLTFINHPEHIEYVLVTNHRNFIKSRALQANRRVLGNGLLTNEGQPWLQQRRLVQPAFHRERIAACAGAVVSLADRLLERWPDGATVDLHQEMLRLTLAIVSRTLFSADVTAAADEVGAAVQVAIDHFDGRAKRLCGLPVPGSARFERAARALDRVIGEIISRRRESRHDPGDLLSLLLQAPGEGLAEDQIRDEAMTIFLAGYETPANALTWTWYLLAQHPEAAGNLYAEVDAVLGGRLPALDDLPRLRYTEMVLTESLRLYPPAWALARQGLADVEIGGYPVRAGTTLLMSQWVMHRDPRYYADPERFWPERWADGLAKRLPPCAYFPFGAGPRLCIGRSFALMEMTLILAIMARRFRLRLAPGCAPVPQPSISLRPRGGMPVQVARR